MKGRIARTFENLRQAGTSGFIAYITAGDPSLQTTLTLAQTLEEAGVDLLELGIPFSDPLADGPTIQAAANRALASGTTITGILAMVEEFRKRSQIPIVLFTYLNPIYQYGFEKFHADAARAGADGILILDLPPDEAAQNKELTSAHGLDAIRLIAPTTPPDRMEAIARSAEGFIYYVSREGVTGEQATLSDSIVEQVAAIRKHTSLPIAVGFGISTPQQAAQVAKTANAVVIGSAIVRCIEQNQASPNLMKSIKNFVTPLAEATHRSQAP